MMGLNTGWMEGWMNERTDRLQVALALMGQDDEILWLKYKLASAQAMCISCVSFFLFFFFTFFLYPLAGDE